MKNVARTARLPLGRQNDNYDQDFESIHASSLIDGIISQNKQTKPKRILLTEEEKKAQITNILYPLNPHAVSNHVEFNYKEQAFESAGAVNQLAVHFHQEGIMVREGSAEDREVLELKAKLVQNEAKRKEREHVNVEIVGADKRPEVGKPLRSQFNFADRGCQSQVPLLKHRGISTVPPATIRFADTVTQWMIYDKYMEVIKAENEEGAEHSKARRMRHHDEGDDQENVLALAAASGAAETSALLRDKQRKKGDELMYSPELRDAARIMQRLISQNSEADIYHDYKYYDDTADSYRDRDCGQLMPLWRFHSEKVKRKHVTAIKWNPKHQDMFAVGYGSYVFGKQAPSGAICVYSLKNSRIPEMVFTLESGVCSLDWHPSYPWLLCCGLYDGSVAVYDVRTQIPKNKDEHEETAATEENEGSAASALLTGALANPQAKPTVKRNAPLYISRVRDHKHTDPVWDVKWNPDQAAGANGFNFFSISSDGRIAAWSRLNDRLDSETVCELKLVSGVKNAAAEEAAAIATAKNEFGTSKATTSIAMAAIDEEEQENSGGLTSLAGGLCFALHPEDNSIFLVGTEEGLIHKCSRAYSGEYLFTYVGHSMAVYSVEWNRYHKNIFLSCSADWTVRMWDDRKAAALLSFDLDNPVGDIAWAPYSSTVFAAVTASNTPDCRVYDLNVNKNTPLCEQKVIKKGPLTKVSFAEASHVVLVGDQRGGVTCLKISPNLRKPCVPAPEDVKAGLTDAQLQVKKLDKILDLLSEKPLAPEPEVVDEEEEEEEEQ